MQKSDYKPIPKEDAQFFGGNEHKLKKKTAKWLIKKYDAFADSTFTCQWQYTMMLTEIRKLLLGNRKITSLAPYNIGPVIRSTSWTVCQYYRCSEIFHL